MEKKEEVRDRKFESIREAMKKAEFGNTIFQADEIMKEPMQVISTGSLSLDLATGVGGYPKGRIVDIWGNASTGKSLLSILAVKEIQKQKGIACIIDLERAYKSEESKKWLQLHGVNIEKLFISKPKCGEKAMETVVKFVKEGADLIIVDSTASIIPLEVMERSLEDSALIASQARLINEALKKITPLVEDSNAVVMFIHQVRSNISAITSPYSGEPREIATGGKALEFYSSIRIRVRRKGGSEIKEGNRIIGHRITFKVTKNKVAPPLREGEFDLYYEKGIDNMSEIFQVALEEKVIKLEGKTYSFNNHKWIGQDKAREDIKSDKELQKQLYDLIRKGK